MRCAVRHIVVVQLPDLCVDLQKRALLCTRQKSKRWHLSLFYFCIDVAAVNAFIVCETRAGVPELRDQKMWRCRLVDTLLKAGTSDSGPPPPVPKVERQLRAGSLSDSRLIGATHLPQRSEKRASCNYCYWLYGNRSRTTDVQCTACLKFLCFTTDRNCFLAYHSPQTI
jgi:hypothetical protein